MVTIIKSIPRESKYLNWYFVTVSVIDLLGMSKSVFSNDVHIMVDANSFIEYC